MENNPTNLLDGNIPHNIFIEIANQDPYDFFSLDPGSDYQISPSLLDLDPNPVTLWK